jgi:FlaA1/EpsC-like NDP-sugar epimerase
MGITQNSLMGDREGSGRNVLVLSFLRSGVQTVICLSSSVAVNPMSVLSDGASCR